MELIYLYIRKIYGEDYNLCLNFSQSHHVDFNESKNTLSITPKNNYIPDDFFGKNIINISAILGKNGAGKSTIIDLLAFSGQAAQQNTSQYFIIYKENDNYFIEGNIDEILVNPVRQRYFDKISFSQKLNNKPISEIDGEKLCFLKINAKKACGNRKMFKRFWSQQSNNREFFEYLASKEFKDTFKVSRNNYLKINFTEFNYQPFLTNPQTKEELLKYIEEVSPDAFRILDINITPRKFHFLLDEMARQTNSEELKKHFILTTSQYFYQNFLLFIYSWVFEDRDDYDDNPYDYSARLKMIEKNIPNKNTDWFNDINKLDSSIKDLLNDELSSQMSYDHSSDVFGNVHINLLKMYNPFQKLINIIKKLNADFFITKNWIELDINSLTTKDINKISSLLDVINDLEQYLQTISICNFGEFSSGEKYLLDSLAQINTALINRRPDATYVLLLDEYELHLHPEWSRQFLDYLIKSLKNYSDTKFQIILTSHSPYLASDLPKNNVYLLQNKNGFRKISTPENSFASNYYTLLKNNFFLNNTVGEFAKNKIQETINSINAISIKYEETNNYIKKENYPYLQQDDLKKDLKQLIYIDKTIKIIDDDHIQTQLTKLVNPIKKTIIDQLNKIKLKNIYEPEESDLRKELDILEKRKSEIIKQLGTKHD